VRIGLAGEGENMDLNLIALGIVGWVLVQMGVLVLMRMSSDQDRAARRAEKLLIPYSDVTITQYSSG
jgi:hypothetical protein